METTHQLWLQSARLPACKLAILVAVIHFAAIVGTLAADTANPEPQRTDDAMSRSAVVAPSLRLLPAIADTYPVTPTQHSMPVLSQPDEVNGPLHFPSVPEASEELLPGLDTTDDVFPIDLPTSLRLAGANNLQIALATEQIHEAAAQAMAARALWIPSLNAGVVYNHHDGRIQATEGEVLDASRSSLFVGGAAVTGSTAAAGSGGNPRLFVDLSLADAIFEPLAARQLVRASAADRSTTFNDTLLEVAAAYLALARAQLRLEIAEEAVRNANELARITSDFAEAGQGLQADADRATIEAAARERDAIEAQEVRAVASANLARLLRLDPAVQLQSAEQIPTPIEFVETSVPMRALIEQAVVARPEIRSANAQRDAAGYRRRQEHVRPWIPHLYAGVSGGGFGGGEGSDIENFGGRADFDVAAVWELQNFGFGNVARQREQRSVLRQANLTIQQVRELIAAEVVQAYQRVQLRRRQIAVTRPQVETANQAMRLNLEGIRGGELRPIEIQQAIGALATSRTQFLDAVTDYNLAQLQLLRAVGQPPEVPAGTQAP